MKFEHFALNVPDVRAMSRWYVEHVGLSVVRSRDDAPYTHFLGDDTGRVFIELYSNQSALMPDYGAQHPLVFHFAMFTADAAGDRMRLEKAGATFFVEDTAPDGTRLVMMRDPWGVALQLCQRSKPFPGFKFRLVSLFPMSISRCTPQRCWRWLLVFTGASLGCAKLSADNGLLFHVSADQGATADFSAGGTPEPTFLSEVTVISDGAKGPALSCGNVQRLAWKAPGNIQAQRGT